MSKHETTTPIDRDRIEREGWVVEWLPDSDADPYDWGGEGRLGKEAFGCVVRTPYKNHEHGASLWGIWDPDQDYRREVEKDLLEEALENVKGCTACSVWKPETVQEKEVDERWKTRYRKAAQSFHIVNEGECEVDDNAEVSMDNPLEGAYVQAWIWVSREDL